MLIFAVVQQVETGGFCREGWNKGAEQDRSAVKEREVGGIKKTNVRVSIQSII